MQRSLPAFVLFALLMGSAACSGLGKLDYTTLGRDSWQRPEEVIAALAIPPGGTVADIGAGTGYFVPYLSDAVGEGGRVIAVDVDRELMAALEERFAGSNVEVVLGGFDDPVLPDGAVDVVLIVNTFHHVEDRVDYFSRLRGDLRPGGRVAILEPNAELTGVLSLFTDAGHVSEPESVTAEMLQAGYRMAASHDFLPVQIFEVFEPNDSSISTRSSHP